MTSTFQRTRSKHATIRMPSCRKLSSMLPYSIFHSHYALTYPHLRLNDIFSKRKCSPCKCWTMDLIIARYVLLCQNATLPNREKCAHASHLYAVRTPNSRVTTTWHSQSSYDWLLVHISIFVHHSPLCRRRLFQTAASARLTASAGACWRQRLERRDSARSPRALRLHVWEW